MIAAQVLLDHVNDRGERVTTLEVTCHRFVLAEFNTHRAFSRNSASSRAIPLKRMIARVRENPALPISFPKEQTGMSGGEELQREHLVVATSAWISASLQAAATAERLGKLGLHKSVANRILEPFLWHTIIVTSTEWENFFAQRCSPLAMPEIQAVAELMRDALDESVPDYLDYPRWHTPLIQPEEENEFTDEERRRVSAARCARVSYLTHDGKRDVQADLDLYDKLVTAKPPHASPLEHVCKPAYDGYEQLGNLIGYRQLRHLAIGR